MDFLRLLCGCCGSQETDSDLPYSPLGNDDVMHVRDPPIANRNLHAQNAHVNCGYDAMDSRTTAVSTPTPLDNKRSNEQKERAILDDIVEATQHNIIAVGQVEHTSLKTRELIIREQKYEEIIYTNDVTYHNTQSQITPAPVEFSIDFELATNFNPIKLPGIYEGLVASVPANHAERLPFACPNNQCFERARPLMEQRPRIMEEHPDVKKAGRTPAVSKALRQKLKECAQEIHNGVEACQIEHKTQLVVFMDL